MDIETGRARHVRLGIELGACWAGAEYLERHATAMEAWRRCETPGFLAWAIPRLGLPVRPALVVLLDLVGPIQLTDVDEYAESFCVLQKALIAWLWAKEAPTRTLTDIEQLAEQARVQKALRRLDNGVARAKLLALVSLHRATWDPRELFGAVSDVLDTMRLRLGYGLTRWSNLFGPGIANALRYAYPLTHVEAAIERTLDAYGFGVEVVADGN